MPGSLDEALDTSAGTIENIPVTLPQEEAAWFQPPALAVTH